MSSGRPAPGVGGGYGVWFNPEGAAQEPGSLAAKLELSEECQFGELSTALSSPLTWISRFNTTEWVNPRVGRGCASSVRGWFELWVKLLLSARGRDMPSQGRDASGFVGLFWLVWIGR
jgi:hypothetical protein